MPSRKVCFGQPSFASSVWPFLTLPGFSHDEHSTDHVTKTPRVRSHFKGPPSVLKSWILPNWVIHVRESVWSFLFFSDLQLHETRADLSHRREQVVITRKWGLESHTHVLRLPGMEDL